MHDVTPLLRARIDRLIDQRLTPARYLARAPVTLTAWEAPGEPVPFAEATQQIFTPFSNGDPWGTPWGTTWFHVIGDVPPEWYGSLGTTIELIADIGFTDTRSGFQCEGLAYSVHGRLLKGVEPANRYVRLAQDATAVNIYLEAASNPDVINEWTFVPTEMGRRETSGAQQQYRVTEIALALRDETVCALLDDLRVLCGLIDTLPEASTRRARISLHSATACALSNLTTLLVRPRRDAKLSRRFCRDQRQPPHIPSSELAMHTSIRRGCGLCGRQPARWLVPSPTSWTSLIRTMNLCSLLHLRSSTCGSGKIIPNSSSVSARK